MKVLLFPVGSHGDVHPYAGLALELKSRGHQVSVITSLHFADLMQRLGIDFHAIDTQDEYESVIKNPNLFHPRLGFKTIAENIILPWQMRQYEFIKKMRTDDTVIVGSSISMGLPLAHEKLGVPFLSIHLQPVLFWSNFDPPTMTENMPAGKSFPRWWNAGLFWLANQMMIDPVLKAATNESRVKLGLPTVKRASSLWHSPQRVLGFFPKWYAEPQPDWPQQTVLTGFPLWDESTVEPLSDEVQQFLDAGDSPIAFTPGSGMVNAADFFREAAKACQLLNRRGILLTRFSEQIPQDLPEGVRHFEYVPFSRLMPHCSALVYHGGIGTLSQACQAGVPHLIMPMSHDQPDNAVRIKKLGIGDWIARKKFKAAKVAAKLDTLLNDPQVQQNCKQIANKMKSNQCLQLAADEIEKMLT